MTTPEQIKEDAARLRGEGYADQRRLGTPLSSWKFQLADFLDSLTVETYGFGERFVSPPWQPTTNKEEE